MNTAGWTPLHAQLHRTLRQRQLLPKGSRSLVAVSGGQDSLCLVQLLLNLQPKWQWQLAIVHCNHQWRQDATANADYVEQLAKDWGVPCFIATSEEKLTSEAAARQWRYQVMAEFACQSGYSSLVTGHTASDRAETLLYNLVRGSGADGLQALTWQRPLVPGVMLVRPLLEVTRAETGMFCETAQLQVWEDSTNQDWHYARNRIRQELIPYLQTHFNPQVEQTLNQTAELLRAEVEYLEAVAIELLHQCSVETDFPPRLDRSFLKTVPLALQRRVMRQFLVRILPIAPTFDQIEKLVGLIAAPNRSQTDPFPGGMIAQVDDRWIVMGEMNRTEGRSDGIG
ncbi:tRNA lysidine(34) synthetase TilS [Egbenema bharatensis]|uniref:tRNA lysidine(34) synthetase TilS n=1 Tax=Egbenema bharatensis TaxID=3463334 RepID=UPI003A8C1225